MSKVTEASLASPQLTLALGLDDDTTLENYFRRKGLGALHAAAVSGTKEPLSFVHGGAEGGKTHLLQALCHPRPGAVYLPLAELAAYAPESVLADLEHSPLLAIDDLHCVAGSAPWEEALFHLVNRCRQLACPLWFAARRPPAQLGIDLADLRSRLAGGLLWSVPAPSEDEKLAILEFRAGRRGLRLPDSVVNYIAARSGRSMAEMLTVLARLDDASLRLKRSLTVPLVREVMGW
ncbi:MAG: DnaA regulatory inactivator Hda [Pseudomonadota bacterium]